MPQSIPTTMRAMVLVAAGSPLQPRELPVPRPGPGEVLLRVAACAVCRTDLHVVDGELPEPALPLIPGHEIVGRVVLQGEGARRHAVGSRVGVPWLGWTCGRCECCLAGAENLCPEARFTGYTLNGGYAEYAVADERYCFALPAHYDDEHAAPLLCAGLIGHRAYRMALAQTTAGPLRRLGLYGFGAAAHLIAQVAIADGMAVHAFTRAGDEAAQRHARELGASWAGAAEDTPPQPLDAALIFAPVGALVPAALAAVRPGGAVICAGIHMSDIPAFPYDLLWRERGLRSVANLTRADGEDFLAHAGLVSLRVDTTAYPLAAAEEALRALREGRLQGAAVLRP